MPPDHYNDDQQGFYYDQLISILRGKSDELITDDHVQALAAEINGRWDDINNWPTESPF